MPAPGRPPGPRDCEGALSPEAELPPKADGPAALDLRERRMRGGDGQKGSKHTIWQSVLRGKTESEGVQHHSLQAPLLELCIL